MAQLKNLPGEASSSHSQYQHLLELDKQPLILNNEPSECCLCTRMTPVEQGVVLLNCLHSFCTACLRASLLQVNPASPFCPYPYGRYECEGIIKDTELEAILGREEYDNFVKRQFEAVTSDKHPTSQDLDLLLTLTDASIVPNQEPFDCSICFLSFRVYEGIILRECFHNFCRDCLMNAIKYATDVVVRCPFQTCDSEIQDREIRSLLNEEDYKVYLERSLKKAESLAENAFHCRTPDCSGWCLIENNISLFTCPVCHKQNCLRCKVIHTGITCEDYQDQLNGNADNRRSERVLHTMVATGQAMNCPKCQAVITKIGGCDNVVCAYCKIDICWITRGLRWGPLGKGDTSGGCRCGVNGRKCHPSCLNCH